MTPNCLKKIAPIATLLMAVPFLSAALADEPPIFKIYGSTLYMHPNAQAHLGQTLKRFNDDLEKHNLVISSIVFATIENPDGSGTEGARARSLPADDIGGKICTRIAEVDEKGAVSDDEDIQSCLIWWHPEPRE